jgi:thioredoxin domain-containing protein 5
LCSEQEVSGYPTLKFFSSKGAEMQRYKGSRDLEALQKFVQDQLGKVSD